MKLEAFKVEWWWFDPINKRHIHEFSTAWEILRRTHAYRLLYDQMCAICEKVDKKSLNGVLQKGAALISFRNMLPQSPPAPRELREMVGRWQNMIANGWTPEKTYLEAIQFSDVIIKQEGKEVFVPPCFTPVNQGIPIILPRQVMAKGHTLLLVESCNVAEERIEHLIGPTAPTDALKWMRQHGKPFKLPCSAKYIAVQFTLIHPPEALKTRLKSGLDKIGICAKPETKDKPLNRDTFRAYHRGRPHVIGTCNPLEIIAFFSATLPRNVVESGFNTLIRPERVKKILPEIRKKWVEWDAGERAKHAPNLSAEAVMKRSCDTWDHSAKYGKLSPQSTARPIRPKEDMDNLACGDCDRLYKRNRSQLPAALPKSLRRDADFNKRVKTGCELVGSIDKVFLPLLKFDSETSFHKF